MTKSYSFWREWLLYLYTNFSEPFNRIWQFFAGDNLTRLTGPYWVAPTVGNVLITGGNTGLGKESALYFAKLGYRVIITVRDAKKGQEALQDIIRQTGNQRVELLMVDLSSLKAVKEGAQKLIDRQLPIHILINNAGGLSMSRTETGDGIETTWQANHVAPFYFTQLLLENIKKASPPGRIVNVSSQAHWSGVIDFDDIQNKKRSYQFMRVYGTTKLANILFTKELQRRLIAGETATKGATKYKQGEYQEEDFSKFNPDKHILTVSLHPGMVKTEFGRSWIAKALYTVLMAKTPEWGARTQIYAALAPAKALKPGAFYQDALLSYSSYESNDMQKAARLWVETEELIKKKVE